MWVGNAEDGDNKGWFAGTYRVFLFLNVIYYITLQLLLVFFYIEDSDFQSRQVFNAYV